MDYDQDQVDDLVLALLFLGLHDDGTRAWKSFDWAATERLHAKGMLEDPVDKAKSVGLVRPTGSRMPDGCG